MIWVDWDFGLILVDWLLVVGIWIDSECYFKKLNLQNEVLYYRRKVWHVGVVVI